MYLLCLSLSLSQLELEGRVATVLDLVKVSVVDHCTTRTCAVERLVEENDSAISKRLGCQLPLITMNHG